MHHSQSSLHWSVGCLVLWLQSFLLGPALLQFKQCQQNHHVRIYVADGPGGGHICKGKLGSCLTRDLTFFFFWEIWPLHKLICKKITPSVFYPPLSRRIAWRSLLKGLTSEPVVHPTYYSCPSPHSGPRVKWCRNYKFALTHRGLRGFELMLSGPGSSVCMMGF